MDAIRVAKVGEVLCSKSGSTQSGTVHLTAHHLIFAYDEAGKEEMWVPYPLIALVTRMPQTIQGRCPLTFRTRTFETFTLSFKHDRDAMDVFDSVKDLTVATSVTQLYAFHYTPNPPFTATNGWTLYNPREEYGRMGVGSRTMAWRFTDINKDYSFCSTYPAKLVVPKRISDTTLQYASKYRSKCRIPVLTYLHWANYGTLTRSSQPMVGLTQNRSVQDEKLIEAIFQSHIPSDSRPPSVPIYGATATNIIIDARPTTNAVANTAKGAGTENMDHYKDARKAYLGIDNIHTMRDSLARVVEALRETEIAASSVSGALPGETQAVPILDRQALRRSGWLRHISNIMEGTLLIVRNVHVNSSHVLIHCSDGWDRTAQLSALSQLCLDPYYRTIRGFQILVEKDWVSFGHKFLDRCGHLSSEKFFVAPSGDANASGAEAFFASVQNKFASQKHLQETSPVFHQFLECVRQVQRQHPERFEFNERFLRQLHYHLYSCQFGSFIFNTERERRVGENGVSPIESTISVWDFFNSPPEMDLNKNPDYDPSLDDPLRRGPGTDMGVLMLNPKDVRFWHELYGRTDEEMNGKYVIKQVAQDPEFVAPIESAEDDPAMVPLGITTAAAASSAPPSRSDSPLPSASSSSPTLSRSTLQRTGSPAPLSPSPNASQSLPPRTRHESLRGFDSAYASSSSPGASQTSTPRSPSPRSSRLSPRPPPSPRATSSDLLASVGVRSMWGRFSSNASAALSVVQDAYGGVAKDLSKLSLGGAGAGAEGSGGELKSREEINAWSSPDRPESPPPASAIDSTRGNVPAYSASSSSGTFGFGGSTLNPWATTKPNSRPGVPSMLFDNPWGSNGSSAISATPTSSTPTSTIPTGLPPSSSSTSLSAQSNGSSTSQAPTPFTPPATTPSIPVPAQSPSSNPRDPLSTSQRTGSNWDLGMSDLGSGRSLEDVAAALSTSPARQPRSAAPPSAPISPEPQPQAQPPSAASDPLGVGIL
ncbi:myotubularin family protein [Phanerochaete sordida]|uniref:Myotubularin family protein n=1 Tax=Phanerochaete sordida TaxID=48140 RepID=A0A9P3GJ67_9APHY|nr:myotubularin family protein [Phanerochaete sordida]